MTLTNVNNIMKKVIIHYNKCNKLDIVACHLVIGQLLSQFYNQGLPEQGKLFLVDYQGFRIQGRHNMASITFHVTQLP